MPGRLESLLLSSNLMKMDTRKAKRSILSSTSREMDDRKSRSPFPVILTAVCRRQDRQNLLLAIALGRLSLYNKY